jgi:hypothetical protein
MRIARQQVGYLLNFGKKGELQWKRFILSDLHQRKDIPLELAAAVHTISDN